jgi:hypothetical protein
MQVVSGAMGKERVHYQAPDAKVLEKEMKNFLIKRLGKLGVPKNNIYFSLNASFNIPANRIPAF